MESALAVVQTGGAASLHTADLQKTCVVNECVGGLEGQGSSGMGVFCHGLRHRLFIFICSPVPGGLLSGRV